ncbi:MAG: hypothetical protein CVU62_08155 [Deltaproteobacteria bacterium HGW-Deltaproteobacteria-2]|jgi:hypothetical protein|nr:MAG: hypothetical protein CVU62_08155 [Deltaproteobacteria bacterium HGW-Deltaproteobacteria-2]
MKTIKLIIITICIAMLCACSSSDDNGGGTNLGVTAIGGTGSNGSGGTGGSFYVESDGAIKVLKSGSADASFTMPAESSYNFGDYGYTVSGAEEILLATDVPANYAGLYMISGDWSLYKADGTGSAGNPTAAYTVSGLSVPLGATLTINADNNYYGGSDLGAYLEFDNDIVIDGTLKTGAGYNYIYLYNANSYSNNIVVTGTVTTSGENYGWVEFDAGRHFYNSGTIDASGGDNATGSGYQSYGIYIYAYTGSVYSKGTIRANNGNGGNGAGGGQDQNYDYIYLYGGYNENSSVDPINGGSVIVSGTIEAKGGNAGGATGGDGGGWGYSYFVTYGGDMIVNASLNFSGGNASGSGYTGGEPYGADFYCYGESYRRVGVCQISGSFNVNGGNGEAGGNAGYVEVYSSYSGSSDYNYLGQAPDVELLGFSDINLSGGNGTTQGGNASDWSYELYTYAPYSEYYSEYLPAYPIISEANVTAKGGNASASGGIGGTGGYVELATDYDYNYGTSITTITQSGTIDNSGGNATASGGTGGNSYDIYLGSGNGGYCWNVTSTGKLTSKGGNASASGGIGGTGGYISLYSDEVDTVYTLTNLSVTAGTGTTAGSSGSAWVDGAQMLP